ncbi:hypothetical protein HDR63_04415 [bacterium]|nr:hypothetical protein [bacterium]
MIRKKKKEFGEYYCSYKQAYWDCFDVTQTEWKNGACRCKDSDYVIDWDKKECVESEESKKRGRLAKLKEQIAKTVDNLEWAYAGFRADARKWKDADGNFNTARLASDSIAGVVLGTTGALVTSKVVKKNQVKNGFDDIQCTIGGQVVAGWDDQFTIGVNQQ